MKRIYLGLLSALFGTIFWLGFVKGDIIDPGIRTSEGRGFWDPVEITKESEDLDKVYGRLPGDCENPIICFFAHDVWFDIVDCEWSISIFLICLLLLMSLSVFPLYRVFEKLWQKWWKSLVPVKNLYYLVDLLKIRKISAIWWFLVILLVFIISLYVYLLPPCMSICNIKWCSRGDDVICWFDNLCFMLSLIPVIIVFFIYDYFALVSFYRLFRKFGWNKWCSVLWTIFFPIWASILWFWNFKPQWEKLGNKKENK